MMRVHRIIFAAAILAASACHAQGFPSKPLRLISPYPPGGGNDTMLRTLQPKLSEHIGQQVIVDNRPGANTIIGTEIVARSAPDGHTMVLVPNSLAINPYLYPKIPYDAVKDFAPVTLVGISPLVVALHPSLPAKDVGALIALARARPGQVQYGSSGNGSVGHMAVTLLELMTETKFQHIPYKGTAPMLLDVIRGQMTFTFTSALGVMPHVKSGRLRAIAVTSEKRSPALPDLPTVAETVPGYSFILWYGLVAAAGTPPDIVNRLNAEIGKVLNDPEIRTRLASQGVTASPSTPREFADLIAADLKKFAKVVKQSGAKAE
ncbi:MAG: tripartite tricarboxylate transporter substrate binding protein [Betaproteobacteria bacterium]|nr:MAG: tripartite tricarboxylate transporter substrate binding protein [Betaproteobacteria bacterium]